ncbi:MAG: hypothetical protein J4F36_08235 [Nitrosopumilaceae archaeon]|nr:hypothetical protein [Nitrosopumilaceae archaeon]
MNKTSIRLLKKIGRGIISINTLKKEFDKSDSHFNLLVKDLVDQNYIQRQNDSKMLQINLNPKYTLFNKISQHYDIEKMLHDSNEQVLINITEPTTFENIEKLTGFSLRTIQRAVSDFKSIGIITKKDDKISLKRDDEDIFLFAKYLKTEEESKLSEPNSEIIYQDNIRVLKKTLKNKNIDGELTGFSLFSDYGIDYHTINDYYIKQQRQHETTPLKLEDVLVHSIISATKNQNKNEITLCMLFYLKNRDNMDPLEIRRIARMYSVSNVWLDMEGYIRNNLVTNTQLFLPKDEFEQKARLYNISPDLYTLPTAYPKLFEEIGQTLEDTVTVYLFGGENMRKKGIKPRTKDCDIIVTDENQGILLVNCLEKIGYASLNKSHFTEDDNRIDPFDILEHPARSRIDLFKTRIARKLLLSEHMIKRATLESFGKLCLYSICNEDLFLLKSVTLREGDIQDLGLIVQAGNFDWKTVWDELLYQEYSTKTNFSSSILESLDDLHSQTGIVSPFYKKLRRRALDGEIKSILRENSIHLEGLIELLEGGDITEKMIRNRIDYLEKIRHLRKIRRGENNNVYIEAERKINLNVHAKNPVDSNSRMKKYITTYSEQLQLSAQTVTLATKCIDKITKTGGGVGRKPSGLAAAILYFSCIVNGENVTVYDIRKVSQISSPSFANLYKLVKILLE